MADFWTKGTSHDTLAWCDWSEEGTKLRCFHGEVAPDAFILVVVAPDEEEDVLEIVDRLVQAGYLLSFVVDKAAWRQKAGRYLAIYELTRC
jgi:hypothetical protein